MTSPNQSFDLVLTRHAITRMHQRGFRPSDVGLVLELGTPTHDGILLSRKDVEREVAALESEVSLVKTVQSGSDASAAKTVSETLAQLRRRIAEIRRLNGTAVYMEEGVVVSVYRPCAVRCSRMMREGRSRVHGRRWWRQVRTQHG